MNKPDRAYQFMYAMRGTATHNVIAAVDLMTHMSWSRCNKQTMAHECMPGGVFPRMVNLDIALTARRARARQDGCAHWKSIV